MQFCFVFIGQNYLNFFSICNIFFKTKRKKKQDDDPDFAPSQSAATSSKPSSQKENDPNMSNVVSVNFLPKYCNVLSMINNTVKVKEAQCF